MTKSEIVFYHYRNPDPLLAGCLNTHDEDTDGVVFPGVEPMEGAFCFIGRQSIVEAAAALFGLTAIEVTERLDTPEADPPVVKRKPGRPKKESVNGEDRPS